MRQIDIKYGDVHSTILIDNGIKSNIGELCIEHYSPSRVHIITDKTVSSLYLEQIIALFNIPVTSSIIEDGEPSKCLSVLDSIYSDLNKAEITRSDLIIALGGGVVGDIGAYAAGTYLRGTKFCMIPTTLLSQVDSSVGGKCGINTSFGKNTVGMFNAATLVIIDPEFLKTLTPKIYSDGCAEVIKYAFISPKLSTNSLLEDLDLSEIIATCVNIKADIVSEDLYDTGLRMILNLGHTVGHAIERLGEYKRFTHGEGVAMGLIFATKMSIIHKGLCPTTLDLMYKLCNHFALPTECPYSVDELYHHITSDKKRSANDIKFIFIDKDNLAVIDKIQLETLKSLLKIAKEGN